MEGNQENNKKKNSSSMSFKYVSGAGGLAGIILLGGALATAAVVSIFAYKKKHQSTSKKNDHLDHDDLVGDGLSFLVPESLSPQCNNISNGTQSEMVSEHIMVLDETTSKTNGEKNEEINDVLEKARESHESSTNKEKLLVQDADNLLLFKPEELMKDDDNILVSKFSGDITTTDAVVDNDREIPVNIEVGDKVCGGNGENIEGNNKYLADQLGVDGEEGMDVEETNEKQEVLEEFEKLGGDDEYHMVGDECDENGERQVEAAVVSQLKVDDNSDKGGGKCVDDAGLTIENCEEFVWEVVDANGIQGGKILDASTICGDDQSIRCCGGILINRNETETCDSKKGDNGLVEDHLVIVDLKIKGDEANDAAARKDEIKFANRGETQLLEANGEKRKDFNIYRENAENICEEADENVVENEPQRLPCEDHLKNVVAEDQEKYNSDSSSTEIVSTQTDGFKVQEFSFPVLDSPSLFKSNKNDSSETDQQAEDANTNKKNSLVGNVFAYQIMLENKPMVESADIDEKKSCDDDSTNDVGKGDKKLETVVVDIAQKKELSEQCCLSIGRRIDEETFEIIHKENLEVENNQHSSLKEDNYDNDNVSREEESDSTDCAEEGDESNKSDEEDTTDEVDESSETTADSSLDSNEEAIWPTVSMQEFSQVKETQTYNQKLKGEDRYVKFNNHKLEEEDKDSFEMNFSKKLTAENTTLEQPTNFFNLKVWFLSLMVPFLLLLWHFLYHISFLRSSQCHLE